MDTKDPIATVGRLMVADVVAADRDELAMFVADVTRVASGAKGAVLDAGRSTRTANRAQRRALRAMHRTCGHPDCPVPFSMCKIHHILWW